eukprot:scaffold162027_cov29-Tisochrysis_lutea.AAC.4
MPLRPTWCFAENRRHWPQECHHCHLNLRDEAKEPRPQKFGMHRLQRKNLSRKRGAAREAAGTWTREMRTYIQQRKTTIEIGAVRLASLQALDAHVEHTHPRLDI